MSGRRRRAFGGVLQRGGEVLLREPTGHFGGTVWTFAKGSGSSRESPEEIALREVREETGWEARIVAKIPGTFAGTTSDTEYFLMEPVGTQGVWDAKETHAVRWVSPAEARALIAQSNPGTRDRDLAVLAAALEVSGGRARRSEPSPEATGAAAGERSRERAASEHSREGSTGGALSREVLVRALALAEEAAHAAGQILRGQMHLVTGPEGGGSHAVADELAEAAIKARLDGVFPGWKWYAEEGAGSHPGANETGWVVDPNDGTSAYLAGYRGSAVSIALVHHGAAVLGVVYAYGAPDDDGDLISGAEGLPLRRNGVVVAPRDWPSALGAGHLVLLNHKADSAPRSNAKAVAPARFRGVASIAYRLALIAVGDADAAISMSGPTLHDVAGGHALVRCAGGEVVGESGEPLRYDTQWFSNVFGGSLNVAKALAERSWSKRDEVPDDELSHELARVRPRAGQVVASPGVLRRAQGCLLGQIAGDSLGSLVEFKSAAEIAKANPGGVRALRDGGYWNTLAGQPTDDSELALMLARCLARDGRFESERVVKAYEAWFQSEPFDVGPTTSAGLDGQPNLASESNGSLMRASPLGVFGWCAAEADVVAWARSDSALTHPNAICQDACAVFVATVAHAIRSGQEAREVYRFAREVAQRIGAQPSVVAAVEAAQGGPPKDYETDMGWVLTALHNAFWQLLHAPGFEQGVVDTVARGGDTDTTAAIAGALLGAVYGRAAVPAQWQRAVLSCRPIAKAPGVKRPRPEAFWPVDVLVLAERLVVAGAKTAGGR